MEIVRNLGVEKVVSFQSKDLACLKSFSENFGGLSHSNYCYFPSFQLFPFRCRQTLEISPPKLSSFSQTLPLFPLQYIREY